MANTSFFGTNRYAMAHALALKVQPRGWTAKAEEADYETCLRRGAPFLASMSAPGVKGHALFVEKLTAENVEMVNPVYGVRQQVARAVFEQGWDKTVIYISKED